MKSISPGFGDNIEGRSRSATVLGGGVGRVNLNFLDEVGPHVVHQGSVGTSDLVVRTVHRQVARIRAVAVDSLVGRSQ